MPDSDAANRIVVVSGASGFLGSALCRHLALEGYRVRALVRRPGAAAGVVHAGEEYGCNLPDQLEENAFENAEAFVHCAFETRLSSSAHCVDVNVRGSALLLEACRSRGVSRIIFISSMSAHDGAASGYGRAKLEVEALLDRGRDLALRPGLIIGDGGVFWRTARSIAAMPAIPLFYGGRQRIQTVALSDVCHAVSRSLRSNSSGAVHVAEADSVTIRDLYGAIAAALGRRPRFVRLPGDLALTGLRLAERLGFRLPLSSDNLLGLKHLRVFDVTDDLKQLDMHPKPMRESLRYVDWERLK